MKKLSQLILILLIPCHVAAGWVITGRVIDREGNTILKRYFIEGDQVKVEVYNFIYSIDLKTQSIILVDPENLVYTKTNLTEYTNKLKEMRLGKMNELLSLIPDNLKLDYEKKYKIQIENEFILTESLIDTVSIKKVSDSIKLLSYTTSKFIVSVNNRKKEELYFTHDINISNEFNFSSLLKYVNLLEPEDKTIQYRFSSTFKNAFENGMILRRFMFEDGYKTEWQVNNIEKKKIAAYEFGAPDLCKELSLNEWLNRKKGTSEILYDDYE